MQLELLPSELFEYAWLTVIVYILWALWMIVGTWILSFVVPRIGFVRRLVNRGRVKNGKEALSTKEMITHYKVRYSIKTNLVWAFFGSGATLILMGLGF